MAGMSDSKKNPRFWRERADETRTKAESFCLAESERKRLLRIAAEYEQLDDREQWRTDAKAVQRSR